MWFVPYAVWTCLLSIIFWICFKYGKDSPVAVILIYIIGLFALYNFAEYRERQKIVGEAIESITGLKASIAKRLQASEGPRVKIMAMGGELEGYGSVEVSNTGKITIIFGEANEKLSGKTIVFAPRIGANGVEWDCRSVDFSDSFLPNNCEGKK